MAALLQNMEGGRWMEEVMVPKGKNGYWWQILNQIFQKVVSFLSSARRKLIPSGSSGLRAAVS